MSYNEVGIVIDRIEEDQAVVSVVGSSLFFDLPLAILPAGADEGHAYTVTFTRQATDELERRQSLISRLRGLTEDDDGGDFSL